MLPIAWAFIQYALTTPEGQVSMLKSRGLVPSLLAALDDPYVQAPQDYWGGQKLWADMLATMNQIPPYRGTPYYTDGRAIMKVVVNDYLTTDKYASAKDALDDAADQLSAASGLPIADGG